MGNKDSHFTKKIEGQESYPAKATEFMAFEELNGYMPSLG
jgi:hypothetical protein